MILAAFLVAASVAAIPFDETNSTPTEKGPVSVSEMPRVEITAGASQSIRLEVRVADGHRVQANPASSEFLVPLEVVIEDGNGLIFGSPVYPEPELYLLEGADDPLMTYAGSFEVIIPVAAADDADPSDHEVSGELRYQACNSRMCLFPATLPVSLQIAISPSKDASNTKDQR